ncbi:MAG TPA: hydrogenase maturation protease [Rhodopila sp.]
MLIVGIGNPDRGDDAIGPLVVRRLAGRVPPDVATVECGGDVLALIDDWAGHDAVILVDATASSTTPGRIHRIDPRRDELLPEPSLSSTHGFGVAEAIALARTLDLLPRHLIIYAIEGACFEAGAPVSRAVVASINEVVTRVADEVCDLSSGTT